MPIEEVVLALKGFAGAYGKVADELLPNSSHELRVSSIDKASFHLSILAWVGVSQVSGALDNLEKVSSAAKYVFSIVGRLVDAKKHLRGKHYEIKVEGSNHTVILINNEGGAMEFPKEAIPLLQAKTVDPDLEKIASPLEGEVVSSASMIAADANEILETTILSEEKELFSDPKIPESSNEVQISGTFISANKESLRGIFKRMDGHKIPYKFIGEDPQSLHSSFSHWGTVRVSATAFFDESLELKRLEIKSIVQLQPKLNFPAPES
ncbi:MAG TPA: hypothetical protein VMD58_04865 [Acidobacteriaceae bacterium]|nr:hypothetical protein [Acidobacteriaceae bacterium]